MNTPSPSRRVTLSHRLFRWFLEASKLIGIAIGSLIVFGIIFFISIKTGIVIPARWCGLFFWTAGLLWVILRQYKDHLRSGKFWITLLALLAIHLAAFAAVLQRYPAWRMAWFPIVFVVEGSLILAVLGAFVEGRDPKKFTHPE